MTSRASFALALLSSLCLAPVASSETVKGPVHLEGNNGREAREEALREAQEARDEALRDAQEAREEGLREAQEARAEALREVEEARAERAMQELRKFLPARVLVRRSGREVELLVEDLVVGDVFSVGEGDRVPADARIVESRGLLVDNAPLTGESRAVSGTSEPALGRLVESPNVLFAGASVLRGSATAVVYATGRRTEFGRVAALAVEVRRPKTPLELETTRMVRTLTIIALGMGICSSRTASFRDAPCGSTWSSCWGSSWPTYPRDCFPRSRWR